VLAASTHPTEETLIAKAFLQSAADDDLLIVAPRHPERGEAVAADLAGLGLTTARRSAGGVPPPGTRAYVADTLGELGLLFRLADVAVMGGGFAPGIGGHNPLEPARLGLPILTGPSVFNAPQVYAQKLDELAANEPVDGAA
jgi:3-deoxy-D-manno-octulosonic-acid transferase